MILIAVKHVMKQWEEIQVHKLFVFAKMDIMIMEYLYSANNAITHGY